MTATLEQVQSDWRRLIDAAQRGEEVMITIQGRVVAKLTGVPAAGTSMKPNPQAWLAKLAKIRESMATGKSTPTTEEILDDLRSDRG